MWASSGLTESGSQLPIDEALVRLLFSGTTTLGDATRAAKAATTDMDVRRTWILFGDPSDQAQALIPPRQRCATARATTQPTAASTARQAEAPRMMRWSLMLSRWPVRLAVTFPRTG